MMLPRSLDRWLQEHLRRRGYVFMRETNRLHHLGRRMHLVRSYGIDLVLDVGANEGQYAQRMRRLGYRGQIASFEPMRAAFQALDRAAAGDPVWSCFNFGLGADRAEAMLHVSENSVSSSLLPMLALHDQHAPRSRFVAEEQVELRRLDDVLAADQWRAFRRIWLKIDVQGFEHAVLAGAARSLDHITALQMELSLVPLYDGQLTFLPMLQRLAELGFDPVAFEPGFEDKSTGEFLQLDGLFRNRRMRSESPPLSAGP